MGGSSSHPFERPADEPITPPRRTTRRRSTNTQPKTHLIGPDLGLGLCLLRATDFVDAQVSCGDTIPKGRTVTFTADLECDGVEEALLVDSATLDLGGHTVSCVDTNGNGRLPNGIVLLGKKA